ncbi:MAG: YceI family protein [Gammaproteobacteria bacterium]|nr:YceI family protein [Gammaproteobacteria bacterium]MXW68768.1 YceI family protein [Acidimicrobiia bacterium]MCY3688270.1 YceI family protein [Gammaproteobacteria bacterium]MDE0479654.1 YceI family protein [Gammaproteobacteria bacterium]MDE0509867.1 YceI family protein [Gammaproteobacteria bacterium]
MPTSLLRLIACSVLLPAAFSAQAQWQLDNDASTLSFVTIKADHVGEVHTFDLLTGMIDDEGNAEIAIELISINTLIPIRDERMQNMLFETSLFPEANLTAQLDIDQFAELEIGRSATATISFDLSMRDQSNRYQAEVKVTRLADDGIQATTLKPVIVVANSFDLVSGVEALREVAGLPSISNAVPVSFTVVFRNTD